MHYEIALAWLRYSENVQGPQRRQAFFTALRAFSAAQNAWKEQYGQEEQDLRNQLDLWYARVCLLYDFDYSYYLPQTLGRLLTNLNMTPEDFYNTPYMDQVAQENRAALDAAMKAYTPPLPSVTVYLDGKELRHYDAKPCILNDRTMVPVYQLTKALGAKVVWDGAARTVTITRASDTVLMTIDDKIAYVDGSPVSMDAAPCILEDRTMIPAAYVALFFGQSVTWDGETRSVYITEDKSAAGDSNLEAWAIPMGYYLNSPHIKFGGYPRSYVDVYKTTPEMLQADSWSITNRKELVQTVLSMTVSGHNTAFLEAAALANSLSNAEYQQLLAQAGETDAYMWPYTKQLSAKWGERGILCWDLFRMSNLVQWGYKCGYITYAEALVLLEPAVTLLKENFSSWDEAFENYVDGYNWWARNNVLGQDTWETSRGEHYQFYKKQYGTDFFNDALFHQKIIPVPGLTIDDILATLS